MLFGWVIINFSSSKRIEAANRALNEMELKPSWTKDNTLASQS